jgi:signal transduction histidine kinase
MAGHVDHVERPVAVGLYRVVQESLTNAAKHAGANTVRVRIERVSSHDAIRLTVEDDGAGAGQASQSRAVQGGRGLPGMRERIAALGGRLDAGRRPPYGFVVDAWIPLTSPT